MESTPPSHRSNPKSASRLARISESNQQPPNPSLDLALPSPKNNDTPYPSPASLRSSYSPVPVRELLLLSPSPLRKSRTRLADKLEMAIDEAPEPAGAVRKRCKTKGGQKGLLACASPRNARRSRRRTEAVEMKEDKEPNVVIDETLKPRRRKTSVRSKKEKQSSAPLLPSPCSSSIPDEDVCQGDLDRIGAIVSDLVMWRDAAKSTLWFGFGCLCFLSSCFTKGVSFSVFSVVSHLGLLLLGASFLSNTLRQRNKEETRREFHVREEDILRIARRVLPATNFAISKTRELFSGEPSMTLKVTPFLLIGAEYGHLITLWRLCAIGFFLSFTVPKLYSCYSAHINQKVERMKRRIVEALRGCSHKKMVAFSAITAFWKLTSVRTRIFAVFIAVVILRCMKQNVEVNPVAEEVDAQQEEPQKELSLVVVSVPKGSKKLQ
ncbi:PREDICTED: reticulon-like protein B17 [Tarenaya hassleriana]|uniref:reticulon-like protein B17 n=1 Tax=Tarenaya hassleriana TaxID=28532 RepID=UPI00053C6160|nr:PREDICTED: reticulon-like protein B17 [Tarenaya hassleriana]